MNDSTILVTGSNGYLGSVLCRQLLNKPIKKLIAFDNLLYRQTAGMELCADPRYEFVHGDVKNQDQLDLYLKQADIIMPLAAYVGFPICEREKVMSTMVNYDQIMHILKKTSRQQRIVFPNTNSGYGIGEKTDFCTEETPLRPISHYGVTKTQAEEALLTSGRAITLRLATVFGISPRMRLDLLVNDFTFRAVKDGFIVLFEKNFKRNYIHIQDVADAFIFMIENYDANVGQAFNVGLSDANLTKLELAETIKKYVPNFVIEVNEFKKDPDQRDYIVSNAKIEKAGWKAARGLDLGIQELIKAYKILIQSTRQFTNL